MATSFILCSKYVCFFSKKRYHNKNGEMMRKIDLIRSLLVYVAASDKKSDRSLDQNIDILTIDINTVSMFWSKVAINFESIY